MYHNWPYQFHPGGDEAPAVFSAGACESSYCTTQRWLAQFWLLKDCEMMGA